MRNSAVNMIEFTDIILPRHIREQEKQGHPSKYANADIDYLIPMERSRSKQNNKDDRADCE